MIQENIYKKDINRPINGVIKASDKEELDTEIREFVITDELQSESMLPMLFNTLSTANQPKCVWISGDFGSGKSHLLKILSYVLENRHNVDNQSLSEYFADKADDKNLRNSILQACSVPTESILFNIQEKLDAVTKTQVDPIVTIFLKEFNGKMGYDEKKPAIAEIERYFDEKGKYEEMKSLYEQMFHVKWETARMGILLQLQKLAKVMAQIDGISEDVAYGNLRTQIDHFNIDTDGLAKLVKDHLDKHPGSRMIFFVDEVGQFIGKDEQRMLSLQTIAESISAQTQGRAIVMVTSQTDIETAIGHLNKKEGYDFSRIQARFATRLSLTSANADEVIQRRLLDKKEDPKAELEAIYDKEKVMMKSLLAFGEDSQFRSSYRNAEEYATDFPFLDYQFDLLQRCVIELSNNNAFSGKQHSVGERSLLNYCQEVAKAYKGNDLTRIVQFSDMYEGLRTDLRPKIQSDIIQAERTLNDDMALKVLKVLFLIKYVKGFPSTTDNITRLMLPTLDADYPALRSKVQEALNKLVHLSYIEKGVNDTYHYQTNEEKDIEMEIKNEELPSTAINDELKNIFRSYIYTESKVKVSNVASYPFGRMVDGQVDGRDASLFIHFITPLNDTIPAGNEAIMMYSMSHVNELVVVLGEDKYLGEDLKLFKQADKCLTRLITTNVDTTRALIINDKRQVNENRRKDIAKRLTALTQKARLYVAGNDLTETIRTQDLRLRLNEGMLQVIKMVYPNLSMLTTDYTDNLLKGIIASTTVGQFFDGQLDNCCQEVLNKINRDKSLGVSVTVKTLIDFFRENRYGWYEMAVLGMLAKLYKLDKVSFRYNGSVVTEQNMYYCLTNSRQQPAVVVDVEETITNSQISRLKGLYQEFFNDESCQAQSAKDVHGQFLKKLDDETAKLIRIQLTGYKFTKPLTDAVKELRKISDYAYPLLYHKTRELENFVDDYIDDIDDILEFYGTDDQPGSQYEIFKKIATLQKSSDAANLSCVAPELRQKLDDIYNSDQPWNKMEHANELVSEVYEDIKQKQEEAHAEISELIGRRKQDVISLPQFTQLTDTSRKKQITDAFDTLSRQQQQEHFISNLLNLKDEVEKVYNNSLDSINRWIEEEERKRQEQSGGDDTDSNESGGGTPHVTSSRTVIRRDTAMNIPFGKKMLESHEDVDEYLQALRHRLMDLVDDNKNILLN